MVRTREDHFPGVAPRSIFSDVKLGHGEKTGFVAALEFQLRARHPVDAAPQRDIAFPPDLVGCGVVTKPVCQHGLPARTQLHLALSLDPLLAFALEPVRAQEYRVMIGSRWLRSQRLACRRLENRRGLEARRRRLRRDSFANLRLAVDDSQKRDHGKSGEGDAATHAGRWRAWMLKCSILPARLIHSSA